MEKVIQFYNRFYQKNTIVICRVVITILCILCFLFDLLTITFEAAGGSRVKWNAHKVILVFLLYSFFILKKRIKDKSAIKRSSNFILFSEILASLIGLCFTFMITNEMINFRFEVAPFILFIVIIYILLGMILDDFIEIKNINH